MTANFPSARTARTFGIDLAERTAATFVTTLGGVFVAAEPFNMFTVSFWEGAGVAGLAAVGSFLKGVAARALGDPNSASAAPRV
ncbi:holin [Streptomyces sp. SBT349]|uniref:holin n=1 Tax=Streptomyces sp. SBT349 TaxID=1580539 RepID=UPI00066C87EB|nr:holin [Streptomyces sp. SBT349]